MAEAIGRDEMTKLDDEKKAAAAKALDEKKAVLDKEVAELEAAKAKLQEELVAAKAASVEMKETQLSIVEAREERAKAELEKLAVAAPSEADLKRQVLAKLNEKELQHKIDVAEGKIADALTVEELRGELTKRGTKLDSRGRVPA